MAKTFSVGIVETLPIIKRSKGEVNLLGTIEEIANCIETKIDHKLLWKQFPSARLLLMIEKEN